MKRFSMLGLLAILGAALLPLTVSSPADAMVTKCAQFIVSGSNDNYPSLDGHLWNCMEKPKNGTEASMQTSIVNDVLAKVGSYGSANENLLAAANVDIKVFYNGQDAFDTLKINTGQGGDVPLKSNESGRSWASISGQPNLTVPTSAIFVWTMTQWNALNGTIPTSLNATQIQQVYGTTHHELGHQFDVQWAHVQNSAWTSLTVSDVNGWQRAIGIDAGNLSAATLQSGQSQYPQLFTSQPNTLQPNEDLAEEAATEVGGGVDPNEDQWIRTNLPCSYYYIENLEQTAGANPPTLPTGNPSICGTANPKR